MNLRVYLKSFMNAVSKPLLKIKPTTLLPLVIPQQQQQKTRNPQNIAPKCMMYLKRRSLPKDSPAIGGKSKWPTGKNTTLYTIDIRIYMHIFILIYVEIYFSAAAPAARRTKR